MSKVYLKPNVISEPLIWNWYAWPYLIPPHTASCNIVDRHLRIMRSFLDAPQVHEKMARHPGMKGGPFIELEKKKAGSVRELVEETETVCRELIELRDDIKSLEKDIFDHAVGQSMEELYPHIPERLKGCVELVYDLNNQPSCRYIEPLIYRKYYGDDQQRIVLSLPEGESRPFLLSTPRIPDRNHVTLKTPFSDKRLDRLYAMRHTPQDVCEIAELLEVDDTERDVFDNFFADEPFRTNTERNYSGGGVRVRYFGHACVLLETKGVTVLIDPFIGYEHESSVTKYSFIDLPDTIDYVLITHNHQDHFMIETLLQIRHKVRSVVVPYHKQGFLADPSMKRILENLGFDSVVLLEEMETLEFEDGYITGLPFFGEHGDLGVQTKLAYFVSMKGRSMMFAADSNNIDHALYENIRDATGGVDDLFVGMECKGSPASWLYGPLYATPLERKYDQARRLNGSDSDKVKKIIHTFSPENVYVYAMGQEPWQSYIMGLNSDPNSPQVLESNKLIEYSRSTGISARRLYGCQSWEIAGS